MNGKKLFIPILEGTARHKSSTEKAARFILEEAEKRDNLDTELLKVSDFVDSPRTAGMKNENSKRWSSAMTRARGLIIVTPEYNRGYPGELKLMLDEIYSEYEKKPVGICGVSSGAMGGVRAVEALKLVLIELKMVPIRESVYFSKAKELFDEKGGINDKSYRAKTARFFDELIWYAERLG